MFIIDPLVEPPDARLSLPGSKSITNRALISASLASGKSELSGVLFSEDTLVMIDSLRKMGVEVITDPDNSAVTVVGTGGGLTSPSETLWVNQSGTTARFCLPLAALIGSDVVIDGEEQIKTRPHKELCETLESLGVTIEYFDAPFSFPLRINGEALDTKKVSLTGEVSSQFISALLLAAPCFSGEFEINVEGELVSKPYVDMTISVMRAFGAKVHEHPDQSYSVTPTGYQGSNYSIEPDASAASYFFAAAAVSGGEIVVEGLGSNSIQGDIRFLNVLEEMGARVIRSKDALSVIGTGTFSGVDVSMASISDTVPTLAAVAPFASSPVSIRDVSFIAQKESDRIGALITELTNVGIRAEPTETGLVVYPGIPQAGTIQTYDDHRIAMAFSIMGLFVSGTTLNSHQCVAKTFPNFFDVLDQVRGVGDAQLRVLAIDGPAGSGKSTLAKYLARQIGLEYLDTGAMYRSVAARALAEDADLDNERDVAAIAERVDIQFVDDKVFVDGEDLSEVIRGPEVNGVVSQVAANPGVRSVMRRQQRTWARIRGGGVLEGRDIGSVVFPHARLKIYVTATPEERARRRSLESGRAVEDITSEILDRDIKDSTRDDSPLVADQDAVVIDTTGKTVEETADYIEELFR